MAESGRARERRAQGGRAIADQAEPGARSEEIVASYWQRYCGKNDTIGFFGPLAWGRIEDDVPPLSDRSGGLVRSRHVHFEAWAVQALAQALDPELRIATGPHPERDLRAALEAHPDPAVRTRGVDELGRLEAALATVAAAEPATLRDDLAALDAVFVELTGRDATRNTPGGQLATGSAAGIVQLWNPSTGAELGRPTQVAPATTTNISFDPGGDTFVTSGGGDGIPKLWTTSTLQQLGSDFPGDPGAWLNQAYTPDGREIIVVSQTGRGWVWPATLPAWEHRACQVAGRNLTHEEWSRFVAGKPYTTVCPSNG